jgi:type IV secretion system protein TrbL
LPGVILILIACVAPVALFKLLAFVDPNTSSGAALRSGLADVGGVRRLVTGGGDAAAGTSGDASDERSQGEEASEDATDTRLQQAQAGLLAVGGPVGSAAASALHAVYDFGSRATAIGSDLTNQMGVGHMSYHPDLTHGRTRTGGGTAANGSGPNGDGDQPDDQLPSDPGRAATSAEPALLAPSQPFGMNGATKSGGVSSGVGEVAGSSAAAAGGAEAAAAVPIVPV